jgi:formylglycine-generating enzyme required for sulfatase activity
VKSHLKLLVLASLPVFTVFGLGQTQLRNANGIEFVRITPGEFMMGCSTGDTECNPDESPRHRVRITKPFEIGKYEITQAQWTGVMQSNPAAGKGENRPVEFVSKFDTQDFIAQLNAKNDGYRYRLPTEAEWEYAARAGVDTPYAGSLGEIAWYAANSDDETHPVGQKKPNAWGLYDITGNVREWVSDLYSETYYGISPVDDPTGPQPCPNGVVARGGPLRGGPGGPPRGAPPTGRPPQTQQEQIDQLRGEVQELRQQLQQLRDEVAPGAARGGREGPGGFGGPGGRGLQGPMVCVEQADGRGGVQLIDPIDGLPTGLPVARGGGWDQSGAYLRLSARFTYYGPTLRLSDIGFRLVRERL